ncbi:MAG: hypothetical protein E5W83_34105 [Mesorhizobium sp.]|nr:MAG: hypothetical protein E5W83_34105 [Mesorhizobium sp.]
MQGAKGDLTVVVRSDGDRGLFAKIEIGAIPQIGPQLPIDWQSAGSFMSAPPVAWAAAPDCRRRR